MMTDTGLVHCDSTDCPHWKKKPDHEGSVADWDGKCELTEVAISGGVCLTYRTMRERKYALLQAAIAERRQRTVDSYAKSRQP